jgi:hypothetical protein
MTAMTARSTDCGLIGQVDEAAIDLAMSRGASR